MNKLYLRSSLLITAWLIVSAVTHGALMSIPGLFPTGVTDGAFFTNLPLGSIDPHYTITSGPSGTGPNAFVEFPRPPSWVPNQPLSQWIGPQVDADWRTQHPTGVYFYDLTFNLAGLDPSTAIVVGDWTADNTAFVFLNGNLGVGQPLTTGFGTFDTFSFTHGFQPGLNTLTFRVANTGGPSGLHVSNIRGKAEQVPEPSSIQFLVSAFVGLLIAGRRKLVSH